MEKSLEEMSLQELWALFPIQLAPHNAAWAMDYAEQARALENCLPSNFIARISHIGSTAIESICAKPIVDILLELRTDADMAPFSSYDGWQRMSQRRANSTSDTPQTGLRTRCITCTSDMSATTTSCIFGTI